jgi:lysophospholipase L1-like esterase
MSHNNKNTAIIPTPKLEEDFYDWYLRHELKVRAAAACNHELVFIGDSITHLFEGDPHLPGRGEQVWKDCYGSLNAFNLGFGWDRTQNVLWRLSNGELTGQKPRLAVLLIGTNNLTGTSNARSNSPEEIIDGIQKICDLIFAATPKTHIQIMGIFPRGTPEDPLRKSICELNSLLSVLAEKHKAIAFLDIGKQFLSENGSIPVEIMSDGVHPTEAGYRIWAKAIEPMIKRLL